MVRCNETPVLVVAVDVADEGVEHQEPREVAGSSEVEAGAGRRPDVGEHTQDAFDGVPDYVVTLRCVVVLVATGEEVVAEDEVQSGSNV
jgi:hypothetical protein